MGMQPSVYGEKNYSSTSNIGTVTTFSYDDLEHAEWGDLTYTKATAALATYIGARYFVTDNWAVNAHFGLISGNLKKSCGSSYNLFSVGASYKF